LSSNVNANSNSIKFDFELMTSLTQNDVMLNGYSTLAPEYKVYFISSNTITREDELSNSVAEGGALLLEVGSSLTQPPFIWDLTPKAVNHSFSLNPITKPSPATEMIQTSSSNIYFIPGAMAGPVNITVHDQTMASVNITVQAIHEVEIENEIETTFPSVFQQSSDYRMVSFPFSTSDFQEFDRIVGLDSGLGPFGDNSYLVYHYDSNLNDYTLLGESNPPVVGTGYWMAVAIGGELNFRNKGPSEKEMVSVELSSRGWHIIGNPYEGNVLIDQIYISADNTFTSLTSQSTVEPILYTYESDNLGSYSYTQSVVLDPFQAAWVYLDSDSSVTLTFAPALTTITPNAKPSAKSTRHSSQTTPSRQPPSPPQADGLQADSSGGGGCLLGAKL